MNPTYRKEALKAMEALGPSEPAWARAPADEMLTVAELAAKMKTTVRTIEEWRKDGVLRGIKLDPLLRFYGPAVVFWWMENHRDSEPKSDAGPAEVRSQKPEVRGQDGDGGSTKRAK